MAPFPDASKNPVSFSQGNKEFAQCNSGGLYKVAPDQQREPNVSSLKCSLGAVY